MHAEQVLKSVYVSPAIKSCTQNRLQNNSFMYIRSQIMLAEQVLETQFHTGITCSQDMHTEQALKTQFNTDITCS